MAVNKLSLNSRKSKFIIYTYRQKKLTRDNISTLLINNVQIERKTDANFLGLLINEYLNWNNHSLNVTKTISRTIAAMIRLKHYLHKIILHILYNSIIVSHINIIVTSWGFASQRLFTVQKRAMRLITGSKYNAHTEPLFKELSTLTLRYIFKLQSKIVL